LNFLSCWSLHTILKYNYKVMAGIARKVANLGEDGTGLGRALRGAMNVDLPPDQISGIIRFGDRKVPFNITNIVDPSDAGLMRRAADQNPSQVANEVEELADVVNSAPTKPPKVTNRETPGATDADGNLARKADGSLEDVEKLSWSGRAAKMIGNNPVKTFVGISAIAMTAVAGAMLGCTDGVKVTMTDISIVPNTSNTQIEVSYTPPGPSVGCVAGMFRPRINDTFKFSSTAGWTPSLDDAGDVTITGIKDDNTVVLTLKNPITVPGTGVPQWGYATCSSCFENQLAGFVADIITTVAMTALQVLNTVAPAVQSGLCTLAPTLCNALGGGKMAFIIAIICCLLSLGMAAFMLLRK
jgi:hypothetical protein